MDRFHLQLRQSIFLLKFSTNELLRCVKLLKRLASYPIYPSNHSKLLGLTFQRSWFILKKFFTSFIINKSLKLVDKATQGKPQFHVFADAGYLVEILLSEMETECQEIVEFSWGVLLSKEN